MFSRYEINSSALTKSQEGASMRCLQLLSAESIYLQHCYIA